MHKLLALTVLMFAALSAAAQDNPKLDQILAQQTQLRADLDAGKVTLTPRAAQQVRKDQDIVFDLIKQNPTLDGMNIQERVTLDNALERINTAVQGTRVASEKQDVCRYQRVTGSKEKQLVCGTQDDRDHAREGARSYLEKTRICASCGGG
ncbi:hypothetical protein DWG18_12595 [Lysobacter sp. TY2-98]|uniref:hypothetical protein n=1 Tax=Lysobacter sp. TY2-98 TaxID=2290922 RepID=UPI000E20BCB3|nr:hypothetical protein [Lysobacter sp. TY2-98]AXK73030.1 hypothetical protein DWG18_12595 [Lysobacter sp. TY2-98]